MIIATVVCEMSALLKILKFIYTLIEIVFFIIPIILIIMLIIDIGKNVISQDESSMKKNANMAIKRVLMAIALFLVPTFVTAALSLVGDVSANFLNNYNTCLENMDNIAYYEELEQIQKEKEKKELQEKIAAEKLKREEAEKIKISFADRIKSLINTLKKNNTNGSYNGQTYPKLTESQIKTLAAICEREQGTSEKAVATEASLMANLYELKGSSHSDIYDYVMHSGWFGKRAVTNKPSESSIAVVKLVLVNGHRTLPLYVDEHDCWNCNSSDKCSSSLKGDICSISTNGNTKRDLSSIKNRSNYVKDQTIIKNVYGATYTFYEFPTSTSDPFGYTESSYKKIKG